MVSIKMFGVRDEERPMAENWSKEHNVKIDMTSDILTSDTIDEVKGFDGNFNASSRSYRWLIS